MPKGGSQVKAPDKQPSVQLKPNLPKPRAGGKGGQRVLDDLYEEATTARDQLRSQRDSAINTINSRRSRQVATLKSRKSAARSQIKTRLDRVKGETVTFTRARRVEAQKRGDRTKKKVENAVTDQQAAHDKGVDEARSILTKDKIPKWTGVIQDTIDREAQAMKNLGQAEHDRIKGIGEEQRAKLTGKLSPERDSLKLLEWSMARKLWTKQADKAARRTKQTYERKAREIKNSSFGAQLRKESRRRAQEGIKKRKAQGDRDLRRTGEEYKKNVEEGKRKAADAFKEGERLAVQQFELQKEGLVKKFDETYEEIRKNVERSFEELKNKVNERTNKSIAFLRQRLKTLQSKLQGGEITAEDIDVERLRQVFRNLPGRAKEQNLKPLLEQSKTALSDSLERQTGPLSQFLTEEFQPEAQGEAARRQAEAGAFAFEQQMLYIEGDSERTAKNFAQSAEADAKRAAEQYPQYIKRLQKNVEQRFKNARDKLGNEKNKVTKSDIEKGMQSDVLDKKNERKGKIEGYAGDIVTSTGGWGTSSSKILDILRECSYGGIEYLKDRYEVEAPEDSYGLKGDLQSETSFGTEDIMVAYLDHNRAKALEWDYNASFGWFNDNEARVDKVLKQCSQEDLEKLKKSGAIKGMRNKAEENLDVVNQRIVDTHLAPVTEGTKDLSKKAKEAELRALRIRNAMKGDGTSEAKINEILKKCDTEKERRLLRQKYNEFSGELAKKDEQLTVSEGMEEKLGAKFGQELSGHEEQKTEALASIERSQERIAAAKVAQAGQGGGTTESTIVKELVKGMSLGKSEGGGQKSGGGGGSVTRPKKRTGSMAKDSGGGSGGTGGLSVSGIDRNWLGVYLYYMERGDGMFATANRQKKLDALTKRQVKKDKDPPAVEGKTGQTYLENWLDQEMGDAQKTSISDDPVVRTEAIIADKIARGNAKREHVLLYGLLGTGTSESLVKRALSDGSGKPLDKGTLRNLDRRFQKLNTTLTPEEGITLGLDIPPIHEWVGTTVRAGVGNKEQPGYWIGGDLNGKVQFEVELLLFGKPEGPTDYKWIRQTAEKYAQSGWMMDVLEFFDLANVYVAEERLKAKAKQFDETYKNYLKNQGGLSDRQIREFEKLVRLERAGELSSKQADRLKNIREKLPGSELKEYADKQEKGSGPGKPGGGESAAKEGSGEKKKGEKEKKLQKKYEKLQRLKKLLQKEQRAKQHDSVTLTKTEKEELDRLKKKDELMGAYRLQKLETESEEVKKAAEHYDQVESTFTDAVVIGFEVVAGAVISLCSAGILSGPVASAIASHAAAMEIAAGVIGALATQAGKGAAMGAGSFAKQVTIALGTAGIGAMMNSTQLKALRQAINKQEFDQLMTKLDELKQAADEVDMADDEFKTLVDDLSTKLKNAKGTPQLQARIQEFQSSIKQFENASGNLPSSLSDASSAADDLGRKNWWASQAVTGGQAAIETGLSGALEKVVSEKTYKDLDNFMAALGDVISDIPAGVVTALWGRALEQDFFQPNPQTATQVFFKNMLNELGGNLSMALTQLAKNPDKEDTFWQDLIKNQIQGQLTTFPTDLASFHLRNRRNRLTSQNLNDVAGTSKSEIKDRIKSSVKQNPLGRTLSDDKVDAIAGHLASGNSVTNSQDLSQIQKDLPGYTDKGIAITQRDVETIAQSTGYPGWPQ